MASIDPVLQRETHLKAWESNPLLRATYHHYYEKIQLWLPTEAPILEVGSGIGNFKAFCPRVISSDVIPYDTDVCFDALRLPFDDDSLGAIVLIDVLHHLQSPSVFFQEAQRCLLPGGRIILLDVWISMISHWVLKWFHPEPVDFQENFWESTVSDTSRDPWDANQAMATKLFGEDLETFQQQFPNLPLIHQEPFDWCWPLCGGFSHRPIFPFLPGRWLNRASDWSCLNRFAAFRCLIVLEKSGPLKFGVAPESCRSVQVAFRR